MVTRRSQGSKATLSTQASRSEVYRANGPADVEATVSGDRGVPVRESPGGASGQMGDGLTAEKMRECVWVRPELVAEVESVEWTPDGHLRHASFVGMRSEKEGRRR